MRHPSPLYLALAAAVTIGAATAPTPEPLRYPAPPRAELRETLHGHLVADPYRPLEEQDAPATRAWIAAEDRLTRQLLEPDPAFERLRKRIETMTLAPTTGVPIARGDRLFYLHGPAGANRLSAFAATGDAPPRLLVDVEALPPSQRLVGLWPSLDGAILAYGVGEVSARRFDVRFLEVASGKALPDVLSGLSAVGGSPAWTADGRTVFYSRYALPAPGAEATATLADHRLLSHRLGASGDDPTVFALAAHPEWTYSPTVTDDGRYLVVTASTGSGPSTRLYVRDLRDPAATARPLVPEVEAANGFLAARGDTFWVQTTLGAPRGRIVRIELASTAEPAAWTELVPEREDTLYFAGVVAERLLTITLRDARHVVEVFGLDGRFEREVPLPDLGTTFSGFVGRRDDRFAYFSFNGIAYPGSASVFRLDPRSGETVPFGDSRLAYDPTRFVTEQVFFRSQDGTRVPMYLSHRRDVVADGTRPAILYAYGAFGWAATPYFQPQVLAWMEEGGIWALANVRGGGEYGESWHQAGIGPNRRNAVDDYLAAAEWLYAHRWAAPGKLVANGGSASGSLAALAMIERPELFGAVLVDIPITDHLRYDRFTGGARWRSELGDPADPAQIAWLLPQSPLHNLAADVCYPPTLITAGEKDETAPPLHAYKLAAALQAGRGCGKPTLLQVVWGGGHAFGNTREQTAETHARQLVFLARALDGGLPAVAGSPL